MSEKYSERVVGKDVAPADTPPRNRVAEPNPNDPAERSPGPDAERGYGPEPDVRGHAHGEDGFHSTDTANRQVDLP